MCRGHPWEVDLQARSGAGTGRCLWCFQILSLSLSLSLGVCQKSESTAALCVAFSGNSSLFSVSWHSVHTIRRVPCSSLLRYHSFCRSPHLPGGVVFSKQVSMLQPPSDGSVLRPGYGSTTGITSPVSTPCSQASEWQRIQGRRL